MKNTTHHKVLGWALAAGLGVFLAVPGASAQEIRKDVREIRRDTREIRFDRRDIRQDTRDIRHDRRALRTAIATDHPRAARAIGRDLRRDKADRRADVRDLERDKADRRRDVRELRRDIRHR